jgi:RNA polymerase sigma factor (sigma-70 family)
MSNSDPAPPDLGESLRRIRAGDQRAAEELVAGHEGLIRRAVRYVMMKYPRLRQNLDSADVAQEVLLSFFVGLGAGNFDLRNGEDLRKLLVVMARHKAIGKVRALAADKRNPQREEKNPVDVPTPEATPSAQVCTEELLEELFKRLAPQDRWLLEQRFGGRGWAEIADELRQPADTVSKRLRRALARVARELGVDGFGEPGE